MGEPGVGSDAVETDRPRIDTSVAHPARRYNYWLGGKDNFQADRESGDAIAEAFPTVRLAALENRAFMRRAVTYLTGVGVRQFLDIGTGIPAPDNTHQVAQAIAPESRVVYVDNDPIVLSHARALLTSTSTGATAYLEADLRQYREILAHPDLLRTIDLHQPVALLLVAIMHFIYDHDEPYAIVGGLMDALPSGSHLVMSHATAEWAPPANADEWLATPGRLVAGSIQPRSLEEFTPFFEGLELVEPGYVPCSEWRDEDEPKPRPTPHETSTRVAVGRKP